MVRLHVWFRLVGQYMLSMEVFWTAFYKEFLPVNYHGRLQDKLAKCTQHPDKSLLKYIGAMQELYLLAEPRAVNVDKVEHIIIQAHPTFAAYLCSSHFRDFQGLAVEVTRIKRDVLHYVRSCHVCQSMKPRSGKPPGLMQPIDSRLLWQAGGTFHATQADSTWNSGQTERSLYSI